MSGGKVSAVVGWGRWGGRVHGRESWDSVISGIFVGGCVDVGLEGTNGGLMMDYFVRMAR